MNILHPALKPLVRKYDPARDCTCMDGDNECFCEIKVDYFNAALLAVTPILYKLQEEARQEGRIEMWKDLKKRILSSVEKFIKKVETGRARSKETYADMKKIRDLFAGGHPTK